MGKREKKETKNAHKNHHQKNHQPKKPHIKKTNKKIQNKWKKTTKQQQPKNATHAKAKCLNSRSRWALGSCGTANMENSYKTPKKGGTEGTDNSGLHLNL